MSETLEERLAESRRQAWASVEPPWWLKMTCFYVAAFGSGAHLAKMGMIPWYQGDETAAWVLTAISLVWLVWFSSEKPA